MPLWSDEQGKEPLDDERDLPWFILIVLSLMVSTGLAIYYFGDWL